MTALDRYHPAILAVSALNKPIERIDFVCVQSGFGDVSWDPHTLLGCDGRSEVVIERQPSLGFADRVSERQPTCADSSAPPQVPE